MPLYMDIHRNTGRLTAESLREAHKKDLEIEDKYGVKYRDYWFSEESGRVFCLFEGPNKEAGINVHREAHGMLPDEVIEVREGSPR